MDKLMRLERKVIGLERRAALLEGQVQALVNLLRAQHAAARGFSESFSEAKVGKAMADQMIGPRGLADNLKAAPEVLAGLRQPRTRNAFARGRDWTYREVGTLRPWPPLDDDEQIT